MATVVEQLPHPGGRRPPGEYPWDEWLDGQTWVLQQGVDYTVATRAMRAYAYRAGRARDLTVSTVRGDDDTSLTIRAKRPVAGGEVAA